MATTTKSIEERIEDIAKQQLNNYKIKYYEKTTSINSEIDEALKSAPSKSGGKGNNFPDIKLLLQTKKLRRIPVMIEVKGKKGDLIKLDNQGRIENLKKDKEPNYNNISRYAVNGAVHYAEAIISLTESFKEAIAIGINGYEENNSEKIEFGVYYLSEKNFRIPKLIEKYEDLSFLSDKNLDTLINKIDDLNLTEEEIEYKTWEFENDIEVKLKALNQEMHDVYHISVGSRVQLICGMIMAGLGVENKVAPLQITDLKGQTGEYSNDGQVIITKVTDFLNEKKLPREKKEMVVRDLKQVFIASNLWHIHDGESYLKKVYTRVKQDIMPIFTSAKHLDFTGKLFNVLNAWVDIPDSEKNDVVLTPRYVTDLMAKIAGVNMDSYVWDYAVGSAGFLISAMKLMIKDAENRLKSPELYSKKVNDIKCKQLLGIEKRADIYMLAILNMILMEDGSANILHEDSLTEFQGNYEQGELKGQKFPANVFLLNPPYSADGKGFIFVKKALSEMQSGRAVVLIQENAGSGNGLPFTQEILENNSLLASIHMSDIFYGKAGVQTAIYVFEIGKPHDVKQIVKFINFENDGYTRQNRKKSSQNINLKNTDHAIERYEEVANLVLYGRQYLHYFNDEDYIEDTITLNGKDWTFAQHKKIDTIPTEEDFQKVVRDYLSWKVSSILKNEGENF